MLRSTASINSNVDMWNERGLILNSYLCMLNCIAPMKIYSLISQTLCLFGHVSFTGFVDWICNTCIILTISIDLAQARHAQWTRASYQGRINALLKLYSYVQNKCTLTWLVLMKKKRFAFTMCFSRRRAGGSNFGLVRHYYSYKAVILLHSQPSWITTRPRVRVFV